MFYKPKFCCECGDKIVRTEWKIWASRRFCELCETEFTLLEWLPKIASIIIVTIAFALFLAMPRMPDDVSDKQTIKGLKNSSAPRDLSKNPTVYNLNSNRAAPDGNDLAGIANQKDNGRENSSLPLPETPKRIAQPIHSQQNRGREVVYFCGAETKKGSPCSRKVKGGGRCWQHIGKEAMLPENKLLVTQ